MMKANKGEEIDSETFGEPIYMYLEAYPEL